MAPTHYELIVRPVDENGSYAPAFGLRLGLLTYVKRFDCPIVRRSYWAEHIVPHTHNGSVGTYQFFLADNYGSNFDICSGYRYAEYPLLAGEPHPNHPHLVIAL